MNSPQVSIWIPIIVGIIGLIGIVSGQLINAWREDRRWQREQDKEELRWQRELHKEATARTEANKAHWRDKKFEVYTEILTFTKRWHDLILDGARYAFAQEALPEELRSKLDQANSIEHIDHQDQIDLLATERRAQLIMTEALGTYGKYTGEILRGRFLENSGEIGSGAFFGDATEIINDVITAIRVDLGIAHDQDRTLSPHVTRIEHKGDT
jgi:hypothetical protein